MAEQGPFLSEMTGEILREISFSPSMVEFNPAPQLSPVIVAMRVSQGLRRVVFSFPTNWCIASFRGQYGNQSLEGHRLRANLTFQGPKEHPDGVPTRVHGALVYVWESHPAGAHLFDRFCADPGVIWPELERLLEALR